MEQEFIEMMLRQAIQMLHMIEVADLEEYVSSASISIWLAVTFCAVAASFDFRNSNR